MNFTEDHMLFLAMLLVPEPDPQSPTLERIRKKCAETDKQWSTVDALAKYRLHYAQSIMREWREATSRRPVS